MHSSDLRPHLRGRQHAEFADDGADRQFDAGFDQPEAAADDVEHVLGLLVLVEQHLAGGAFALGHERLQPLHRQVAVDGFLHVAHQLQHLVQPVGIEHQHHRLQHHGRDNCGSGSRSTIRTMLVRMPNTRNGIMVRIEIVATTKIDANRLPGGAGVFCEM